MTYLKLLFAYFAKFKLSFLEFSAIAVSLLIGLIDGSVYSDSNGAGLSSAGNIVLSIIFCYWIVAVGSDIELSFTVRKKNSQPCLGLQNFSKLLDNVQLSIGSPLFFIAFFAFSL
jgi:hypothetical protein